jgi:hypothetical protein
MVDLSLYLSDLLAKGFWGEKPSHGLKFLDSEQDDLANPKQVVINFETPWFRDKDAAKFFRQLAKATIRFKRGTNFKAAFHELILSLNPASEAKQEINYLRNEVLSLRKHLRRVQEDYIAMKEAVKILQRKVQNLRKILKDINIRRRMRHANK